MKTFDVTFSFQMVGQTRCLTIEAKDEAHALEKCRASIKDGFLDNKTFRELGGNDLDEGWHAEAGTDYDYEIDEDGISEA
jgi:hypothetical protein